MILEYKASLSKFQTDIQQKDNELYQLQKQLIESKSKLPTEFVPKVDDSAKEGNKIFYLFS